MSSAKPCLFRLKLYQIFPPVSSKYSEDGIPTTTTSIKNVGLSEPERSGAEYASADRVTLSPLCDLSSARLTAPCLNNMLCGGSCSHAARGVTP